MSARPLRMDVGGIAEGLGAGRAGGDNGGVCKPNSPNCMAMFAAAMLGKTLGRKSGSSRMPPRSKSVLAVAWISG